MPTDGKFVEIVGNYNPAALDQPLVIQKDRIEYWISQGAQPTNTVTKLLNRQGFSLPVIEYHKAPKKKAKAVTDKTIAPAAQEKLAEETTKKETVEDSGVGTSDVPSQNDDKEETVVEETLADGADSEAEKTE